MRKFLQWSLVTLVAVVLLAAVVGQILATSTGRAREASVAALKEKLALLEGERGGVDNGQASSPVGETLPAIAENVSERADAEPLRVRWIALFEKMEEVNEGCGVSREVWKAASVSALDQESTELDEEARDALLKYQTCVAPTMDELRALRDFEPGLGELFDLNIESKHWDGASRLVWEVRKCFWLNAALGDGVGVIDAFSSLSYLATNAAEGLQFTRWTVGETTNWIFLKPAMGLGTAVDSQLNRLYEILATGRSQQHFKGLVHRDTAWMVESFERWEDSPLPYSFSEAPGTYMRSWAYPRLTPALFNHDLDRFSQAMDRLLDLGDKPYFEMKDDLEQFCEDFDVEPDIDSQRFTRDNPGWYYVLYLSRHGFEENARNQASIDIIRFAILLEKHKRDTGNYPETLDVFAEVLGGSLPLNPLMGDAYVYERTDDSFQLGYRDETQPDLVEVGLEPTRVIWWHDPLATRCKSRAKARTRIFGRNQGAKPLEIQVFSRVRNAAFGQKDRSQPASKFCNGLLGLDEDLE